MLGVLSNKVGKPLSLARWGSAVVALGIRSSFVPIREWFWTGSGADAITTALSQDFLCSLSICAQDTNLIALVVEKLPQRTRFL